MVDIERYEAEGSFGDRKVIIEHARSRSNSGWMTVLFHGVHGCSSFDEGNKYGTLGSMLLEKGVDVCLVETSRIRRDRSFFGEDRITWAKEAFREKTYAQDLYDECSALAFIQRTFPCQRLCLWGFSLGGIHSVFITSGEYVPILKKNGLEDPFVDFERINLLVFSGIGDSIKKDESESLSLPILDTISPDLSIRRAASMVKVPEVVFFFGGEDSTFSESSSRRLFDLVPTENKVFHIIKGSDHAFRNMCGVPSTRPLEIMVSTLSDNYFLF
jgi:hypothetical protein